MRDCGSVVTPIEGLSIINEDFGPSLIKLLQPIDQCPIDRTSFFYKGAENTWGASENQDSWGLVSFFSGPTPSRSTGHGKHRTPAHGTSAHRLSSFPTGRSAVVSPLQVTVGKKPKGVSVSPFCSPPLTPHSPQSPLSQQTEGLLRLCNPLPFLTIRRRRHCLQGFCLFPF